MGEVGQSLTLFLHCFTLRSVPKRDPHLKAAISAAGGVVALANKLGLKKQAVSQWERAPAKRVIDIENAVDGAVSRHELRPDIFGAA